jgi:hypothetical protein
MPFVELLADSSLVLEIENPRMKTVSTVPSFNWQIDSVMVEWDGPHHIAKVKFPNLQRFVSPSIACSEGKVVIKIFSTEDAWVHFIDASVSDIAWLERIVDIDVFPSHPQEIPSFASASTSEISSLSEEDNTSTPELPGFSVLECVICQESDKSDWVLPCRHSFHKKCLEEWRRASYFKFTCPICRRYYD